MLKIKIFCKQCQGKCYLHSKKKKCNYKYNQNISAKCSFIFKLNSNNVSDQNITSRLRWNVSISYKNYNSNSNQKTYLIFYTQIGICFHQTEIINNQTIGSISMKKAFHIYQDTLSSTKDRIIPLHLPVFQSEDLTYNKFVENIQKLKWFIHIRQGDTLLFGKPSLII